MLLLLTGLFHVHCLLGLGTHARTGGGKGRLCSHGNQMDSLVSSLYLPVAVTSPCVCVCVCVCGWVGGGGGVGGGVWGGGGGGGQGRWVQMWLFVCVTMRRACAHVCALWT
jgi:hypothetical protein